MSEKMLLSSALVVADGDGHQCRLAQTAASIVVIGIRQEPQQQACENKDSSQQQRFNH